MSEEQTQDFSSTPYYYESTDSDHFNLTDFNPQSFCDTDYLITPYPKDGGVYCNITFDKVLCWPSTSAGTNATLPCPVLFNKVYYDTSKPVFKQCYPNGSWANYTDYTQCKPLEEAYLPSTTNTDVTTLIFFIGYSLSLVAVVLALGIFLYFKDLRCLRNTFHVNLLATYLLTTIFWMISITLPSHATIKDDHNIMAQCAFYVVNCYCQATNYFWMFVEGFYLFMLVVRTFTVDKIPFRLYIIFGWGLPALIVAVWAIVKFNVVNSQDNCPLFLKDSYDMFLNGPLICALVVNMFFLGRIMWVLITKLRAATTAESQQYRKSFRALLVLIPLFGITYVITLVPPRDDLTEMIFVNIRAVLVSTQGFTVSVLYCFLNGEVRNTMKHHFEALRSERNLPGGQRFSCRYRDGSPRSRTESIRLCSTVNNDCRCDINNSNRESCVSCLTTHSYLGNGHSTVTKIGNNHVENQLLVVTQNGNELDGTHSHLARSGTTSTVNSTRENSV